MEFVFERVAPVRSGLLFLQAWRSTHRERGCTLYKRSLGSHGGVRCHPSVPRGTLAPTGGQERGYRRGTENLPAAAAMAAALAGRAFAEAMPRLAGIRQKLEQEITDSGGIVIGAGAARIATIGAYAMPDVASASQLVQLDLAGISVSAGSACSSGSMKPSRVLAAMGVPQAVASCAIRVSFGPFTSQADIDRLLAEWRKIASRGKARAA